MEVREYINIKRWKFGSIENQSTPERVTVLRELQKH